MNHSVEFWKVCLTVCFTLREPRSTALARCGNCCHFFVKIMILNIFAQMRKSEWTEDIWMRKYFITRMSDVVDVSGWNTCLCDNATVLSRVAWCLCLSLSFAVTACSRYLRAFTTVIRWTWFTETWRYQHSHTDATTSLHRRSQRMHWVHVHPQGG